MVKGIENWAHVTGVVEDVEDADLDGFVLAHMKVAKVSGVDSYPNFFKDAAGGPLDIYIPSEVAKVNSIATGVDLSCRVRKAGATRVFVNPEHVEVRSP